MKEKFKREYISIRLSMAINLEIISNTGYKDYTPRDLLRNPRFLLFCYRLNQEGYFKANINKSGLFHEDECELKSGKEEVCFLLNPMNFIRDLEYFKHKYLLSLPEKEIKIEDYDIDKIWILDNSEEKYKIKINLRNKGKAENPVNFWDMQISPNLSEKNDLNLWISLNSFYRQLRHEEGIKPALKYLEVIQELIANQGVTHILDDGTVILPAKYKLDPSLVQNSDPFLEGKTFDTYSYLEDLRKNVFFEPLVHYGLLNTSAIENKLTLETQAHCLMDVVIQNA